MNPMVTISDILGYSPIDIHTHFCHPDDETSGKRYTGKASYATLDFLKTEYDNVGICCGGYSSFPAVTSRDGIAEENRILFELASTHDWIYQWVVLHPEREETFRQAEQMLTSSKTLGIKIHPIYHKYNIITYAERIFSFADHLGAVVLMHPAEILEMASFTDRFPNMKLIIAHLSSEDFVTAAAKSKLGNIYLDTSGGASNLNNIVEYGVYNLGADRILFGTDSYSAAFQLGRVAWARISDKDKKLILRDNAIRLFPCAFGTLSNGSL